MIQIGHSRGLLSAWRRPTIALLTALLLLWVALFTSSPQAQAAPQRTPLAAVVAVGGKPTILRTGASRPLALRQSLAAGDIIETGPNGKVSILFSDGSQTKLGPKSRLQITEPVPIKGRTSFFRVLTGEIWARLRPGRGVQTQYSSLVVRGTEIHLAVAADGTTTLTVLEGEVQFASDFGEVIVRESQQSVVRPGSAPTQPVTVANTGPIVEWTLDLNRAVLPREKSWSGQTGPQLTAAISQNDALVRTTNTAANRLRLGDAYFDAGNYPGALAQYDLAVGLAPANPEAALRRGYAQLELGQLDEAAASFAGTTPASQTGAAWVALERNNPVEAERLAKLAIGADQQAAESRLVLALALMRQPNREKEAEAELRHMLEAQPAWMRPQAHAWLAVLALAQDDTVAAASEAALAVQQAPASALAHSAAASVAFYGGRTADALKLANRAAQMNPDSAATVLALGQAQLAEGDAEGAAATAARATALDPRSAQAFYLLGVADAQRRDYRHSARELETALRLSPDYVAAAALLARVYVRMDRERDAAQLLTNLQQRHPASDTLLTALGETLYAQGKYDEGLRHYRDAVKARPDSALAWNGLARLALDANQLNEAINAGQRATELAPQVGQYHSTLGLAYTYSGLDRQAEREFRTALALDPNNAIALVRLGLANRDGTQLLTSRTLGLSYVQGFMLDPEVSRDLLRGGISTELETRPASNGISASVLNKTDALDGSLHAFTNIIGRKVDGDRPNDNTNVLYAANDTTYSPRPGTTVYLHALTRRDRFNLPGTERTPTPDDRGEFQVNEGILAIKQRMDDRATLWAGLQSTRQRNDIDNPNQDASFAFLTSGFILGTNVINERTKQRSLSPEVRLDYKLGTSARSASTLTLGVGRPRTRLYRTANIILPAPPGLPSLPGNLLTEQSTPERVTYAQVAHNFGNRASLVAQLRHVRYRQDNAISGGLGGFLTFNSETKATRSFVLPSTVANLQVNDRTQLRLLAGRRKNEFASSIFTPVSTLLTTESQILPNGYADPINGDMHVYELDLERRMGTGRLLKLFLFRTSGRNVISDFSRSFNSSNLNNDLNLEGNSLLLGKVERTGLGARYEHQLGRSLFGHIGAAYNRTEATTAFFDPTSNSMIPALFNGQQAPYSPRLNANIGLNYVSRSGNKAGLLMNYAGAMFADTDDITATSRPRFGAKTTFDIQIAREPSVKHQIQLRINNIFNNRQITYNGVSFGQRSVIVQAVRRF